MTKKLKEEIKTLKELVQDLFEESVIEDMIIDLKKPNQSHDDDMHLAHLLILKDRYIDAIKGDKNGK